MKLVIVESPKKCETIAHYLGNDYKVMASQGHIRDLSTKGKGGLGIDVDHDFKPDFVITPSKLGIVKQLNNAPRRPMKSFWQPTLIEREKLFRGTSLRFWARCRYDEASAVPRNHQAGDRRSDQANPSHIDMNLVNSQETRRMYDRIIGFQAFELTCRRRCRANRRAAFSVTLKMICDNDAEIKAFVPQEYWTIDVDLTLNGKTVSATLDKIDGKTAEIHNKEEADAILKRIGESLSVLSVEAEKKSVPSKLPFTTSTMQQEAYNRFKFSTSKTQSIAQRLYEGMDINGEHVGLITYMRTDSTRLSEDFYYRARQALHFGEVRPGVSRLYQVGKKSDLVQDAHEAIRPTGTHRTPDLVARYVEPDEAKLYRLIYDRALASLMSDKIEEQTTAFFREWPRLSRPPAPGPCSKAMKRSMAISRMTTPSFCPRSNKARNYGVEKVDPSRNTPRPRPATAKPRSSR
jgi:DNA topoisomerase-1